MDNEVIQVLKKMNEPNYGAELWISDGWCIAPHNANNKRRWCVGFGDAEQYVISGIYKKRRRAKKEITHYINKGFSRMGHGLLSKRASK